MRKNPEDNELLELFEPLRVADVRDGMDWMGYHHYGTLDYRIRPLERTKAVGIARTARYLPYEGPDPMVIGDEYTEWSNHFYSEICIYPWMKELEEGDFVALDVSGVDVGLMGSENSLAAKIAGVRGFVTNGGGIRATIQAGDITKKDINTVLPFGNTVAVIYVKGSEMLEALEASTDSPPKAIGG